MRRILEYASFPDLVAYPFDKFKQHLSSINVDDLRTSEKRRRFIRLILPMVSRARSWDDLLGCLVKEKIRG